MAQAANGDKVKVNYTGKLTDGTVFDSSVDREPLEFKIGDGQLIPDFEQAVVGMSPGESKHIEIETEKAYGARRKDLVLVVNKNDFPLDLDPEIGQRLQLQQPDGRSAIVMISEIADEQITLDANHPLAGEDLAFEIELLEIA